MICVTFLPQFRPWKWGAISAVEGEVQVIPDALESTSGTVEETVAADTVARNP